MVEGGSTETESERGAAAQRQPVETSVASCRRALFTFFFVRPPTLHCERRALAGIDSRAQRRAGQLRDVDAADAETLDGDLVDGRGAGAVEGQPLGGGMALAAQTLLERVVTLQLWWVDHVFHLRAHRQIIFQQTKRAE